MFYRKKSLKGWESCVILCCVFMCWLCVFTWPHHCMWINVWYLFIYINTLLQVAEEMLGRGLMKCLAGRMRGRAIATAVSCVQTFGNMRYNVESTSLFIHVCLFMSVYSCLFLHVCLFMSVNSWLFIHVC